ncbi:DMT family transporter [Curvibacter sp. APW13]|uniref:DMT family transporter n=1 Tax=Curvibacter sp. APW13 TaxID=3077236 RepID=UPI0039657495
MTHRKTDLDALAVGLLLACLAFWGFQQVLAKATLTEMAPVFQATLRLEGAAVLLLLWCRWRGIALLSPDGSTRAGLLAGVLFALEFMFLFLGLQYTSAARLTLLLYTSPLWVALLLPLRVPAERLGRMQWLGLGCAFVGVAWVLHQPTESAYPQQWLGDAMGLLAGLLWGLTTVVIRASGLTRIAPEKLLMYQLGVSALLLPCISLAMGESWNLQLSAFAWASVLVQASVGAFLSYLVWMWILGKYPATKVSAFTFLTPVFSLIAGVWWLGESVSLPLLGALTVVMAGIAMVNRRTPEKLLVQ